MEKISIIIGLTEVILVSVIMVFSCFSLFIAYNDLSFGLSNFPDPSGHLLISIIMQPLLFGLYGVITFVIGLFGAIRLGQKRFWLSYVGFSLIIVWSLVIIIIASFGRYSNLDLTIGREGIIMGALFAVLSLTSLFFLKKGK